jgi:hypothetical protein
MLEATELACSPASTNVIGNKVGMARRASVAARWITVAMLEARKALPANCQSLGQRSPFTAKHIKQTRRALDKTA